MVVLTVVTHSNPHTVYFDQPIPQPNYIRLLSCSLYNSWYHLKKKVKLLCLMIEQKNTKLLKIFFQATILLRALQNN